LAFASKVSYAFVCKLTIMNLGYLKEIIIPNTVLVTW